MSLSKLTLHFMAVRHFLKIPINLPKTCVDLKVPDTNLVTEVSSPSKRTPNYHEGSFSPRGHHDVYGDEDDHGEQFTTDKSRRIWGEITAVKDQMQAEIGNLESSLAKVLQKHELEYMQAYNIYVKRKETELKKLIDDITNRLGDKVANDKKMKRLELNEHIMKSKAVDWGNQIT